MSKWKNELREGFKAPLPLRKREFIRKLEPPAMPVHEFLLSQMGYIRKWVWCLSALIFAVSVLGLVLLPDTVLWLISGLTPLLALTIVSESGRSELFDMAELEMATRFSLRSVTLARLSILGIMDLILLCVLVPIGLWKNTLSPIAAGLYIITPFLLTAFSGLLIVRKFRGRESMYACVGVTACVSLLAFFSHSTAPVIYQQSNLIWWVAVALLLCIGTAKQYIAIIKRTEELTWS